MSSTLKRYRNDRGLTLHQLGEMLGVRGSTICKWERRKIPADRILEIEEKTGIPRHELRPDLFERRMIAAAEMAAELADLKRERRAAP